MKRFPWYIGFRVRRKKTYQPSIAVLFKEQKKERKPTEMTEKKNPNKKDVTGEHVISERQRR